jgi:hypothetical protein
MLKTVLVRLCLLVPFALVAVLTLRCDEWEPKMEADWVFKDSTGNLEIPAHGYMSFRAEVTPEMLEVKDHKVAYLLLSAVITSPVNNFRLATYLMDENNFFSFQVNGPFQPLKAESSFSYPTVDGYAYEPCVIYGVISNRNDSMPKRAKVGYLLNHWALVPK